MADVNAGRTGTITRAQPARRNSAIRKSGSVWSARSDTVSPCNMPLTICPPLETENRLPPMLITPLIALAAPITAVLSAAPHQDRKPSTRRDPVPVRALTPSWGREIV